MRCKGQDVIKRHFRDVNGALGKECRECPALTHTRKIAARRERDGRSMGTRTAYQDGLPGGI